MNQNLLAVRLYDETVIYSRSWKQEPGRFILGKTKSVKQGEKPIYLEDEVNVSHDAVRVWFKVLRGGNPKEVVRDGPYGPKNIPAA